MSRIIFCLVKIVFVLDTVILFNANVGYRKQYIPLKVNGKVSVPV